MQGEAGDKRCLVTPQHPCSYLPRRQARTMFFDPRETVTAETYRLLTENGFRRSGSHMYRPHCQACNACIPVRIPAAAFQPRRKQKRVAARNRDVEVRVEDAVFRQSYFELYARYLAARHMDGDMFPTSPDQFRSFLLCHWSNTFFLNTYLDGELIAVAVTDYNAAGLSAIYTFFDPKYGERSPGVLSILNQIDLCRQLRLPYLYLGYWTRDSTKMRYKTEYRPVELLVNDRWVPFN